MKTLLLSSMEKIFPNRVTSEKEIDSLSVFGNEKTYFQIAILPNEDGPVSVSLASPVLSNLSIRRIGFVPSSLPAYPNKNDEGYLTLEPGLFPDPLLESTGCEMGKKGEWLGFWISFSPKYRPAPGEYRIYVRVRSGQKDLTRSLTLKILDAKLPEQKLCVTQWFHCDSIAELHDLTVFSEGFWSMTEKYLRTAVENGINMILTPLFTPPLDTAVGGERLTVQLVGVKVLDGKYTFDFSRLDRWIDLCLSVGVKYLEMSHLFTQWGAKACPKIMAEVDGVEKRIFGWDTPALGDAYKTFLAEFLPALTAHLEELEIDKITYFHISDEPHGDEARAQYIAIHDFLEPYLRGYKIMDALSDYSFYESGAVSTPVPKEDGIAPFVEHGVKPLWTYYCCGQCIGVSNRLIAMPSWRNRSIGMQMYKYDIVGFLQWGFNFYNNQFSVDEAEPYTDLSGEHWVPAGDTFSVYPAPHGKVYESLRIVVFHEALQDISAMKLCESLYSKEEVVAEIEKIMGETLAFDVCAKSEATMLAVRARINEMIKAKLN